MQGEAIAPDFESNFLILKNANWQDCLASSLASLNNSWNKNWVGLPRVIEKLLTWLQDEEALAKTNLSKDANLMLDIALHVAELIEKEALQNKVLVDHPYHNRLHFAQVVTSVGIEYAIQVKDCPDESGEWLACLLVCAIGHDYKHTGNVNSMPMELEMLSIQALLPIFIQFGLSDKWVKVITQVILSTDIPTSRAVHARVKGQRFAWDPDWASILLIESDNMASASKTLGPDLGLSLSREWLKISNSPDPHVASNEGRQRYLQSLTCSSHASRVLGVPQSIEEQLRLLP